MQSPVNAGIQHLATSIGNSQPVMPHSKHRAKHSVLRGCGSLPLCADTLLAWAVVVIVYSWAFFWEGEKNGYGSRSYSSTQSHSSTVSQTPIVRLVIAYFTYYYCLERLSTSSLFVFRMHAMLLFVLWNADSVKDKAATQLP